MTFFKPQNNQKDFLKKIKEKELETERRRKKEAASDKLTSVIRKFLSNRRHVQPIIKQAEEKIQAILIKKRQVDSQKFGRMMGNAVFKMPIIMAPMCFVTFETAEAYVSYLLNLMQALTLNVEHSNVVIKRIIEANDTRTIQFNRLIQLAIFLAKQKTVSQLFLKELIVTAKENNFSSDPIQNMITEKTLNSLKQLILQQRLTYKDQQLFTNEIILKHLKKFSNTLKASEKLNMFLNVQTTNTSILQTLGAMIKDEQNHVSEQIQYHVKNRSIENLSVLYFQSLNSLKRFGQIVSKEFVTGLEVHKVILSSYYNQTFKHISNKLFSKMMMVEDSDEQSQRDSKVRRTQEYKQFLNSIDDSFYFGFPLELLRNTITTKGNENTLCILCELYLLLEDIFRKTHNTSFKLLTNIDTIMSIYELIRTLEYFKIDFKNRTKQSILFEFFVVITYHKFAQMDDIEFVDYFSSANKQKIQEMIRLMLKLVIMLVRKSTNNSFFEYSSLLINDIYKKVFRTKLINIKIFQSENLDHLLDDFNSTKKQSNQTQLLLKTIPFAFTFEARVLKLREFIKKDKSKFNRNLGLDEYYDENHTVEIRRGYQFTDAFHNLAKRELRQKYRIVYINQQGMEQQGVDGGGIIKEFINQIIKIAFNPIYGFFCQTWNKQIIPNPRINADTTKPQLQFIGKLVGKALYENMLIEPKFSGPFINIMMGKQNSFEDLQFLDKALYKSLLSMKHQSQNIESSQFTFQIQQTLSDQSIKTIQLKQNGAFIPVTQDNKLQFIFAYADYKVNREFYKQGKFFRRGFTEIIQEQWLEMFNYEQINLMISGNSSNFNVYDLTENTVYTDYGPKDLTVKYFWEVLNQMSVEDKGLFLQYATSSSRPPTLGFKELKPKFCIAKSSQGADFLPTVHTCMNLIKLPDYKNKQKLREKLLYAIRAKAGFDVI